MYLKELLKSLFLTPMHFNPLNILSLANNRGSFIIAGPCSAESLEQVLSTAKELSSIGVKIFRAGLWKPRSKPGSFEGVGKTGLEWLQKVKEETGMATATEVANAMHVKEAIKSKIEILWIGARTTANPFAVQEIADELEAHIKSNKIDREHITILVKNPVNPDLDLWIGAMERIANAGIKQIGAIHRGFSTYEKGLFRNLPHWHIPIELKRRMPHLTILCDPSHIGGRKELIYPISQQALNMGFSGLMIESHIEPDSALSDKEQQITPKMLKSIMQQLIVRETIETSESLTELRREIDELDERLLDLLSKRMAISREIGRYKKENSIPVFQPTRYNHMVVRRISQSSELMVDPNFIKLVLQAIHEESVRQQLEIFNNQTYTNYDKN